MKITPFGCYKMYLAMKMQFNSKTYDFFRYEGKVKASETAFSTKKDKWVFERLSHKYNKKDLQTLMLSNFLVDESLWVNTLLSDEANDIMLDFKKRHQSLTYIYSNDVDTLLAKVKAPDQLLVVKDHANPILLKSVYSKEITLETFTIMNDLMGFFPYFSQHIGDDFLWPKLKFKCEKYRKFIDYDKRKFRAILKEKVNGC